MTNLETLAQHRDTILLAEAIGWLHDYRKCSEEQLQTQSANTIAQGIAHTQLTTRFGTLSNVSLTLSTTTENLSDLLNQRSSNDRADRSFLLQYLSRCHNTAHFDKQDPPDSSKQNYPGMQISTAFGFEMGVGANLTSQLWSLPWNNLTNFSDNRNNLLDCVSELFSTVGADTRRPINEISLWDWGILVGGLYKTAIANAALENQPANADLRWRLLSIRTDGLGYLTNVSRLPDLVARQKVFQEALDKVKTLLEVTYPLATEVYRDENGSLYVVPDIPTLLELKDNTGTPLLSHIKNQFMTDGEIVPQICLDTTAWRGQDPNRQGNDQIPPAGAILSTLLTLQNSLNIIQQKWQGKQQQICSVCGLRPCVSKQLDLCDVCIERRRGRVNQWFENPNTTIWLDEVADSNGRLALITGTFDLTNWLDGSLVQTMLVKEPTNNNSPVSKTPSFARLRRMWQTTKTFWQETQQDIDKKLSDSRRRLKLKIALTNSLPLQNNHTYQLDLQGHTHLSVVWDANDLILISIDNLSYTATQLGIKKENCKTPDDAALAVGVWLDKHKENEQGKKQVFRLISDDEKNQRFDIQIHTVDYQNNAYAITIPILAEPRTFMALVPVDKALDIVQAIKTKYEREMGKVRNRLPLHLGVIYAQRRTPLRAVLDAGWRMLAYTPGQANEQVWKIRSNPRIDTLPTTKNNLVTPNNGQFTETVTVELEQNGRELAWHVPNKMGDGTTLDHWYPYVFAKNDVSGRNLIFKGLRPKGDGSTEDCWLVHASKLQTGDQVYFMPATFDFEWLDTAGRRFEIAYNEQGERHNHPGRPYLLDDLDTITSTWQCIQGKLTSSQIYALLEIIESKRTSWKPTADDCQPEEGMFWQFCRDTLHNATWKTKPPKDQLIELIKRLVDGTFADVVEIYINLMKQKPTQENN